jgi:hypothetical protein
MYPMILVKSIMMYTMSKLLISTEFWHTSKKFKQKTILGRLMKCCVAKAKEKGIAFTPFSL